MFDGDLSPVYRKRARYERVRVSRTENVHYGPSFDSDILCVVTEDEEFEIDHNESRGSFYKIYTASGIEGFIQKKHVKTEDRS